MYFFTNPAEAILSKYSTVKTNPKKNFEYVKKFSYLTYNSFSVSKITINELSIIKMIRIFCKKENLVFVWPKFNSW